MALIGEKVNCDPWLAELKSTIVVQRKFRTKYSKEPSHRNSIAKWMKKFKKTGSVHDRLLSGRPRVSEESVASVKESFTASPRKSKKVLNKKFPNKWIGRGGPFSWPPRSPDLTPLNFFLW